MKRWILRALVVIVVALALASVSISCGRTLAVSDVQDGGVPGAYVTYHYEGSTFGLVEALTYQASPLRIVKTGTDGRIAIAPEIHVHWPLIQSRPALAVNQIYAPPLHNGLAWLNTRVPVSRQQEFEVSDDLAHVRLADLSNDPARWQGTLDNLSSLINRLRSQQMRGEETPMLTNELIEHFKGEFEQMMERHGDTLRPIPAMPDAVNASTEQEKTAWRAMVAKDLGDRPRWGDEWQRRFGTEIRIYSAPAPRR